VALHLTCDHALTEVLVETELEHQEVYLALSWGGTEGKQIIL